MLHRRRKVFDVLPSLGCEGIEPFGRRGRVSRRRFSLPCSAHGHHVHPRSRPLGRVNVFEAPHRAREPFDTSGALLDTSVQIVAVTDVYTCVLVSIHLYQASVLGSTLIDMPQTRFAVFLEGFFQKASGRRCLSCHRQENIDGIPLLIDGPIKICPLALSLHGGFIHSPPSPDALLFKPKDGFCCGE